MSRVIDVNVVTLLFFLHQVTYKKDLYAVEGVLQGMSYEFTYIYVN